VAAVLVVDDEPDLRFLLRKLLERDGFKVLEARHGEHALEVMQEHHVDVLIVDTDMPVMDGAALIRRLRELRESPPPIVMWSDNPRRELAADAVFAKPYGGTEIVAAVARLTQRT
jgi:DNA-binding response OmpR family regulator